MATFKFTVEGSGTFPAQMLRPGDSYASMNDAQVAAHASGVLRRVTLVCGHPPDCAKWQNVGWPLVEIANTSKEVAIRNLAAAQGWIVAPIWTDVQLLQLHRALREWVNCTATTEPATRAAVLELLK